jgi:NAD(P)H-hydrate repair Nnr-like enzyme with NAD(P)H-hydrate epimerase domain
MRIVLTPEQMAAVDAATPEPVEVLIGRAGAAVARHAIDLLGGSYGRRVVVVAGKGNNGNDGREAARRLEARGVRVRVVDAAGAPARLDPADLVVDAAYGTGFHGTYVPPDPAGAPVLAVDIPSGVDGLTGAVTGGALPAVRTVTFAALKPGLLFHPGRALAGEAVVADIGLDVGPPREGGEGGAAPTGPRPTWPPVPRSAPGRAWCGWRRPGSTTIRACPPKRSASPRPRPAGTAPCSRSSIGRARSSSVPASASGRPRRPPCATSSPRRRCPSWSTATGSPRSATASARS